MIARRHPRGAAILSLVLSLAIIGILSGMYFEPMNTVEGDGRPWVVYQLDRTRNVTCDANRRTAQTTMIADQIAVGAHRMNAEQLQRTAARFPPCPGEGALYIDSHDIFCTSHTPLPRFRDQIQ